MNNIFENAKFGDKFLTRDGQVALYAGLTDLFDNKTYVCYLEIDSVTHYDSKGICIYPNSKKDIVSKYQETIDEEKLDELAWYEAFKKYDIHSETIEIMHHRDGFAEGFKEGFKAKEQL